MRETKFRGLTKEGKWVYGFLISLNRIMVWDKDVCMRSESYEVLPETVGQFTGLHDKNSKEGYRVDIVRIFKKLYVIEWNICNACFYLKSTSKQESDLAINNLLVGEIIGNIHQNPELIEEGKK